MESVSPMAARGGCSFQRVASRMWYQQASSTEAELCSAVECTKYIIYFHDVLDELGFAQLSPTPVYIDNASLLALATKFSCYKVLRKSKKSQTFSYEAQLSDRASTKASNSLRLRTYLQLFVPMLLRSFSLPGPSFSRHVTQLMGPPRESTAHGKRGTRSKNQRMLIQV